MDNIEFHLKDYIGRNLLFSEVFNYADDTSFLQAGIVDSMGVMELVTYVAEQFNIDVRPEEVTAENFDSVTRLADYIRCKRNGESPRVQAVLPRD